MQEGVIILGHGSRREEANQEVRELVDMLRKKAEDIPYKEAFLSFGSPNLEEAVNHLVQEGVKRIVVTPLFLVTGNHIQKDIPRELERLREKYPGVQLIPASHLGPHPEIMGIVKQRINEAREVT